MSSTSTEIIDLSIYYLDIVECPLNPHHKLRRHRLPYHLVKCKKNYPDLIPCPYGHYHYLKKHEMASHLQACIHKPKTAQHEDPQMLQKQHIRDENINYNYDVDNYEIDEPYWD